MERKLIARLAAEGEEAKSKKGSPNIFSSMDRPIKVKELETGEILSASRDEEGEAMISVT